MKLIYHKLDKDEESPFLKSLVEIFQNNAVKITCPYIDRKYLTTLIDKTNDIKVITDVTAWLQSCSNNKERSKSLKLIKSLGEKIHHCDNLHSKVFFNNKKALLGSANLTVSGMRKNHEMSILFNDTNLIEELNTWFRELWDKTNIIDSKNLKTIKKRIINNNSKKYNKEKRVKVDINSPDIFAMVPSEIKSFSQLNDEEFEDIKEIAELFPSRTWLEEFLEIWRYVIENYNIDEDDKRITLSAPSKNDRLAMTIGQRYAVTGYINGILALIMPVDSKIHKEDKPLFKQEKFKTNGETVWFLNYFKTENPKEIFLRYKNDVSNCIEVELERTKVSGYRKHNNIKELYFIASDENKCIEFLNKTFRTVD